MRLNKNRREGRILGRVEPEQFIGRDDELRAILRLDEDESDARKLVLLSAPLAGTSELLRQAYDALFHKNGACIPVYFAFTRNDKSANMVARRFLQTFLAQLIAFRRQEPALVESSVSLGDLLELAVPADYEWIEALVASFEREAERSADDLSLVRLCFGTPQRATLQDFRPLVMLDGLHLGEQLEGEIDLSREIAQTFLTSEIPCVIAGLRRRVLDVVHTVEDGFERVSTLRVEPLESGETAEIIETLARRNEVEVNEQTRDLMVQQLGGKPFFIQTLLQSAREVKVDLTSFLNFQRVYVDALLGGAINRHYSSLLEDMATETVPRRALVRVLYESSATDRGRAQVEALRKRLNLSTEEFQRVLRELHVNELASVNSSFIEVGNGSPVWNDYLQARYRIEVAAEPRALVVAETLQDSLKRAPQTMARHYRRASALGLRQLLEKFNCQRMPASLLHYDRFSRAYKGVDTEEVARGLDAETDLVRLPQVVHSASCVAFHPPMQLMCDEERCAVAHGFDAANYAEANEVVWIAAEIESKMEAGRGVAEIWLDRLASLSRACGFSRVRFWLVSPEGFSAEASELLNSREAYGSSRQQLEHLTARINSETPGTSIEEAESDEFEMVIPMGENTELLAANMVEQIARRVDFQPEAINQIKTALIEACINATEHSLSPDRKIYQRFRVESDKLVVTVSSRGILPPVAENGSSGKSATRNGDAAQEQAKERRGWGLKLIRSLMDEVEFERVDDGTRLRMTKYLHKK